MLNEYPEQPSTDVLSVSDLNGLVKNTIEEQIGFVQVHGEISNLATPRSGHIYFSLKDESASVRCAMFRNQVAKLGKVPEEGDAVLLSGSASLYMERGDYQLIAHNLEPWGLGKLQQAFDQLKAKLQKEGLFESTHKKQWPSYPNHIAVVTSATGAAIQDCLSVLKRRWPLAQVTICPTLVQGHNAAPYIIQALTKADNLAADAILLIRGGGSVEDLWAFNDEKLARCIYACTTPVISGVGHETDFTIADFVADFRAPTPSVAAESVTPDWQELKALLQKKKAHLTALVTKTLQHFSMHCDHVCKRLIHPSKQIELKKAQLNQYQYQLNHYMMHLLTHLKHELTLFRKGLDPHVVGLHHHRQQTANAKNNLIQTIHHILQQKKFAYSGAVEKLDTLSPLNTLKRGFSITSCQGRILKDIQQVHEGDTIRTQLANGIIESTVNKVTI